MTKIHTVRTSLYSKVTACLSKHSERENSLNVVEELFLQILHTTLGCCSSGFMILYMIMPYVNNYTINSTPVLCVVWQMHKEWALLLGNVRDISLSLLSWSLIKPLTYIVTQEVTSQNILYAKYVRSLYYKVRNTRWFQSRLRRLEHRYIYG